MIYGPIVDFIEMKRHSSRTGDLLLIHLIWSQKGSLFQALLNLDNKFKMERDRNKSLSI